MKKLILASQSPRRAEILKNAGFLFSILPTYVSEIPDKNLSLDQQILKIAEDKARAAKDTITDQSLDAIVLSADTMVCIGNKPIGKPSDTADAHNTLRQLSGIEHQVKTAVVLFDLRSEKIVSHIETTNVKFRTLTDDEISDYIATGEPMDKAGSYGIQGIGKKFIESVDGDYNNVVGLPIKKVKELFEVNKWQIGKLIAVSKLQPIEKIVELYNQGYRHFGENYVQEALDKVEALKNLDITWHFIGSLQKNKIKYLKKNFKYIHSIESLEQIKVLDQKSQAIDYVQNIFLQVNLAEESTKSGWTESSLFAAWPQISKFTHIKCVGLMTMPPLENEPENNRVYFKKLVQIGKQLGVSEFSMGTSHDYKIALEEGATWVRLGTILFGERERK